MNKERIFKKKNYKRFNSIWKELDDNDDLWDKKFTKDLENFSYQKMKLTNFTG